MNDPDWARVLKYFYEEQEKVSYLHRLGESQDIVEETGLEPHEIETLLNDMEDIGLLDTTYPSISGEKYLTMIEFSLSKKGFDVAHDREMNKNQTRTNVGIGLLTVFLVIGSLLQGYSAYLTHDGFFDRLLLTIIVVIGLVVGLSVISLMMGYDVNQFWSSK